MHKIVLDVTLDVMSRHMCI